MKRYSFCTLILACAGMLVLGARNNELLGRGRGGGGGGGRAVGGGGSFRAAAPAARPAARPAAVVGPHGGGSSVRRTTGPVVGPAGGVRQAGSGSGSYTTNRGSTINYGGAGRQVSGPGGGSAGRGIGGVQVTTPGGATAGKVGRVGGVQGPGGTTVGRSSGAGRVTGPGGNSAGGAYRGGVAIGPQGGAVGGRTAIGGATGPGRTVVGGARTGVAVGPHGGAAVGRTTVAGGAHRTYYASGATLRTQAGYVRGNYAYRGAFTPGWYGRYPGAWFAAGWTTARIWNAAAWGSVASTCGYPAEPVYYDYGNTIVYEGDTVYVNGEQAGTAPQYMEQAEQIAAVGKEAPPATDEGWQSLGVFAMARDDEKTSYNIFQLAVNKDGVLRGNYYNALADTTEPVSGSVDKKTQRAAWTVGKNKTPVYEAGIANLTKDETSILVHFSPDRSEQFNFIRIEQPPAGEGAKKES